MSYDVGMYGRGCHKTWEQRCARAHVVSKNMQELLLPSPNPSAPLLPGAHYRYFQDIDSSLEPLLPPQGQEMAQKVPERPLV
jgi:hypothetical protein